MKRKLIAILLVASLSSSMLLINTQTASASDVSNQKSQSAFATQSTPISISNAILAAFVKSNGDFVISTTNGDPNKITDDNLRLLYGYTNLEYVKVGDNYSDIADKWTITSSDANKIVCTSSYSGIDVSRTFTLVKGPNSNKIDSIKTDYVLTNTNSTTKNVSFKLMLDTLIGNNDRAPFNIPGVGQLDTKKSLTGDAVPNYWFAYDNFEDPKAVSKASYDLNNKPDTLVFTHWSDGGWNTTVDESSPNGDSCVSAYWHNNELAPGASKSISTYYGLASLSSTSNPDISLNVLNGDNISISPNEQGSYDPYQTSATIKNSGDTNLENISMKIVIPDEFKNIISLDGSATRNIGALESTTEVLQDIKLNVLGDNYDAKDLYYEVVVQSDSTQARTVRQNIKILPNKQRSLDSSLAGGATIAITPTEKNEYGVYSSKLNLKNTSGVALQNINAKIVLPEGLSLKAKNTTKNALDSFTIPSLDVNAEASTTWDLVIAPGYEDRALTYKVIVDSGIEGQPTKELTQTLNVKGLTAPVAPEKPTTPPVQPEKPATKPAAESPKTGDTASFGSLALAMISGLGFAITKKKKYNSKH